MADYFYINKKGQKKKFTSLNEARASAEKEKEVIVQITSIRTNQKFTVRAAEYNNYEKKINHEMITLQLTKKELDLFITSTEPQEEESEQAIYTNNCEFTAFDNLDDHICFYSLSKRIRMLSKNPSAFNVATKDLFNNYLALLEFFTFEIDKAVYESDKNVLIKGREVVLKNCLSELTRLEALLLKKYTN